MPRPLPPKSSIARRRSESAALETTTPNSRPKDCLPLSLQLASTLVDWQKRFGRHGLPWQVKDPYRVWLSEIMLQQTQVATVIPFYQAFLRRFPTLESLANASEESVLEAWSGLGYYSRARNLQRCAQRIQKDHHGNFPDTAIALQALPGIGPSTAAAIAVFCFGRREAILDGNVKRVLSRVFAIAGPSNQRSTELELLRIAQLQVPETQIEAYTQGLMDLGASLCGSRQANCKPCPLNQMCIANALDLTSVLPSPKPRKVIPTRQARFALIVRADAVLLEKQASPGIWGGLLSFPNADGLDAPDAALINELGATTLSGSPQKLTGFLHSFTHYKLNAEILLFELEEPVSMASKDGKRLGPALSKETFTREPSKPYRIAVEPIERVNGQPDRSASTQPGLSKAIAATKASNQVTKLRWLNAKQLEGAALPQPVKAYLIAFFRVQGLI
jgi:A/G-specific adenine glycosylase